MTDQTEAVEYNATDLFDETIDTDKVTEIGRYLTQSPERWEQALYTYRRMHLNYVDRDKSYSERVSYAMDSARALRTLLERDREVLNRLYREIHEDSTKFDSEWAGWSTYLQVAFVAGILSGHNAETHQLARELDGDFRGAEEIYDRVAQRLRDTDGRFPASKPSEVACATAWQQEGYSAQFHPADPRLSQGWQDIWRIAKGLGMCDVFDTLAETLGIPKPHVTRSGTVSVSFHGTVDIDVEEWDGEDIWYEVDTADVERAIRNGETYLEIDEIDTSDLAWD